MIYSDYAQFNQFIDAPGLFTLMSAYDCSMCSIDPVPHPNLTRRPVALVQPGTNPYRVIWPPTLLPKVALPTKTGDEFAQRHSYPRLQNMHWILGSLTYNIIFVSII